MGGCKGTARASLPARGTRSASACTGRTPCRACSSRRYRSKGAGGACHAVPCACMQAGFVRSAACRACNHAANRRRSPTCVRCIRVRAGSLAPGSGKREQSRCRRWICTCRIILCKGGPCSCTCLPKGCIGQSWLCERERACSGCAGRGGATPSSPPRPVGMKRFRWAAPFLLLLVDDSQAPGNGTRTQS